MSPSFFAVPTPAAVQQDLELAKFEGNTLEAEVLRLLLRVAIRKARLQEVARQALAVQSHR